MIRLSGLLNRVIDRLPRSTPSEHRFLTKVPGVIHIGANTGQEREHYAWFGLNVLWIEPIPAVFETLQSNLAGFPKQQALCRFLADQDGIEYVFHVANNGGMSSSILDFARHVEIWPEIHYTHDIRVTATTLTHLIDAEQIDPRKYGALVLDTQGTELLVLKGAAAVLSQFRFIKAEAADFEVYGGCCQLRELTDFLRQHGFVMSHKIPFARTTGGACYDALYSRVNRFNPRLLVK
jgi:FkbM family methyltransferase